MEPGKGVHVVRVMVRNHDNFGAFKSKEISKNAFSSLVFFLFKDTQICQDAENKKSLAVPWAWSCLFHTSPPPHSLSFFSYLTIFPSCHGQPNTFIIFCSTNKAVHWSEVLPPHNDLLSESHCSYTQDNHSTLQLERGNYLERCSSRVRGRGGGGEGIRTGEQWLYCLLREVVKQRTPIKTGCRTKDKMRRYECREEAGLTDHRLFSYSLSKCPVRQSAAAVRGIFLSSCHSLNHFLSSFLSGHSGYTAD